jgi:hypothetical protein
LEPFKDLADDVLTARLEEENGAYTGELSGRRSRGGAGSHARLVREEA